MNGHTLGFHPQAQKLQPPSTINSTTGSIAHLNFDTGISFTDFIVRFASLVALSGRKNDTLLGFFVIYTLIFPYFLGQNQAWKRNLLKQQQNTKKRKRR